MESRNENELATLAHNFTLVKDIDKVANIVLNMQEKDIEINSNAIIIIFNKILKSGHPETIYSFIENVSIEIIKKWIEVFSNNDEIDLVAIFLKRIDQEEKKPKSQFVVTGETIQAYLDFFQKINQKDAFEDKINESKHKDFYISSISCDFMIQPRQLILKKSDSNELTKYANECITLEEYDLLGEKKICPLSRQVILGIVPALGHQKALLNEVRLYFKALFADPKLLSLLLNQDIAIFFDPDGFDSEAKHYQLLENNPILSDAFSSAPEDTKRQTVFKKLELLRTSELNYLHDFFTNKLNIDIFSHGSKEEKCNDDKLILKYQEEVRKLARTPEGLSKLLLHEINVDFLIDEKGIFLFEETIQKQDRELLIIYLKHFSFLKKNLQNAYFNIIGIDTKTFMTSENIIHFAVMIGDLLLIKDLLNGDDLKVEFEKKGQKKLLLIELIEIGSLNLIKKLADLITSSQYSIKHQQMINKAVSIRMDEAIEQSDWEMVELLWQQDFFGLTVTKRANLHKKLKDIKPDVQSSKLEQRLAYYFTEYYLPEVDKWDTNFKKGCKNESILKSWQKDGFPVKDIDISQSKSVIFKMGDKTFKGYSYDIKFQEQLLDIKGNKYWKHEITKASTPQRLEKIIELIKLAPSPVLDNTLCSVIVKSTVSYGRYKNSCRYLGELESFFNNSGFVKYSNSWGAPRSKTDDVLDGMLLDCETKILFYHMEIIRLAEDPVILKKMLKNKIPSAWLYDDKGASLVKKAFCTKFPNPELKKVYAEYIYNDNELNYQNLIFIHHMQEEPELTPDLMATIFELMIKNKSSTDDLNNFLYSYPFVIKHLFSHGYKEGYLKVMDLIIKSGACVVVNKQFLGLDPKNMANEVKKAIEAVFYQQFSLIYNEKYRSALFFKNPFSYMRVQLKKHERGEVSKVNSFADVIAHAERDPDSRTAKILNRGLMPQLKAFYTSIDFSGCDENINRSLHSLN